MQSTHNLENHLQSHPSQDILECLSLSCTPLSEALIAQKVYENYLRIRLHLCNHPISVEFLIILILIFRITFLSPWISDVSFILKEMVAIGDLTSWSVQIPSQHSHNTQNASPNCITVFTPSLDLSPMPPFEMTQEYQETNMKCVITSLHQILAQKGLEFVPTDCIPFITLESIETELSSLKSLRTKYVDRLAQLNEALLLSQSTNTENGENIEFHATNLSSSHDRIIEHKRTKERLRSELKEIIQVLAGVLAEHKNVSIFDIISEYKNLQS